MTASRTRAAGSSSPRRSLAHSAAAIGLNSPLPDLNGRTRWWVGIVTGVAIPRLASQGSVLSAKRQRAGDPKTGARIEPALALGRKLADAVPKVVTRVTLVDAGTEVGALDAAWRDDVPLVTKQQISVVASPGQAYEVSLDLQAPDDTSPAEGAVVGTLTVAGVSTPVIVSGDAAGPDLQWRLTHI